MPIEKKPEQIILSGQEARVAIVDGVQRALGRRIDEKTLVLRPVMKGNDVVDFSITVDVVGSLKGPKPGGKRKPAKKPVPPAVPAV